MQGIFGRYHLDSALDDASISARGAAEMEAATAGAPEIRVSRSALVEAVKAELTDYFANPRASGIALAEWEARYIASGIRVRLQDCQGAASDIAQKEKPPSRTL